METIHLYLKRDGVKGCLCDSFFQALKKPDIRITRGQKAVLKIALQDLSNADLSAFASFSMVLASDWDTTTVPELRSSSVTVSGDALEVVFSNTNTAELAAKLGNSESLKLGAELAGFMPGEPYPELVIQWDMTVTNRRDLDGAVPIPVTGVYYTSAQVDALLAGVSGGTMSVEFSVDGSVWSGDSTGAYFWRFRISETAAWSAAIPIPQPAAVAGEVAYSFTVATGSTATQQTVTWSQLGTAGKTPVRLYQVQSDNSELDITANSRLQIVLNASGVTLFWANDAFPAGNYVIRG